MCIYYKMDSTVGISWGDAGPFLVRVASGLSHTLRVCNMGQAM